MTATPLELLNPIYKWEIPCIVKLQSHVELLPSMEFVSDYGLKTAPFIVVVVLFFLDRRNGIMLGALYFIGLYLVFTLKLGFGAPRPYWISDAVQPFSTSGSFALPSGHVLVFSTVWLGLAALYRRKWLVAASFLLATAMGLSRVYLGVHFIVDVVMGLVVSLLSVYCFLRAAPLISKAAGRSLDGRFLVLALAVVMLYGLSAWIWHQAGQREMPRAWAQYAAGAGTLRDLNRALGGLLGWCAGAIMARHSGSIEHRTPFWIAGIACAYALLGWFLLREIVDMIPGRWSAWPRQSLSFLMNAIAAWWVSFAALFIVHGCWLNFLKTKI